MKYAIPSAFFLFNNEVISWIALAVIVGMALYSFTKEVMKEL